MFIDLHGFICGVRVFRARVLCFGLLCVFLLVFVRVGYVSVLLGCIIKWFDVLIVVVELPCFLIGLWGSLLI